MGKLEIETLENTPTFSGCKTINYSIHEALCLAIHEGDEDALEWLMDNIKDIRLID
jgi:hypothetical protein